MLKVLGRFAGGMALVAGTIGAGAGLLIVTSTPAAAADTLVVNDAGDSAQTPTNCLTSTVTTGPDCTLRAALAQAQNDNVDATITLPDPTTVQFSGAHYTVSSSQLDIFDNGHTVTINGADQTLTAIQGSTSRVLKVESGTTAEISGVTVENGDGNNGGGILDCGDMTLTDSTVTDNTATETGGGIEVSAEGSATLTDDTISNNAAGGEVFGGEIEAGGGVAVENGSDSAASNLTISDSTISGNLATDGDGGGILAFNTSNGVTDPNLTVNISGSTITNNHINLDKTADVFGAGVSAEDGTWSVTGTTITDNGPSESTEIIGGGVDLFVPGLSVTFADDTIAENGAYDAGGMAIDGGNLTMTGTSISDNRASESFAGVLDDESFDSSDSTSISSSTISGNSMPEPLGESVLFGDGGGITSEGCNDLSLTNDTITGNSAFNEGGGYLGIICGITAGSQQPSIISPHVVHPNASGSQQSHQAEQVNTAFLFDTISGNDSGDLNTDPDAGGNIQLGTDEVDDASTVTLAETIVANGLVDGDPGANCAIDTPAGAVVGSLGHNLIDDTTCGTPGTGDIIGQSPQLGALGDNGGPTNTELPATGSPAIGGVPASVCSGTGVTTDQRGEPRGTGPGGSCTIGAVEVAVASPPPINLNGYRLVANEGGIFDFGLNFHGSLANNHLNAPIIGIANSPGYDGYLMAGADGGVFALGGANFYGSLGGTALPSPISAIAAPPAENGYWLAAQNGKVYNFGAAPALPALSVPLGAHIVGMASTQDGGGAWLTDNLGDVYAEGDALFEGGLGGVHLNAPIVGIAAAASGQGYVLAATDGGAFNFGTQGFFGSVPGSLAPGQSLVAPIVGIAVTHSGHGYWFVGADGGVFNYGDAPFLGSIYTAIGNHPLNGPIVGIQHLGELPTA